MAKPDISTRRLSPWDTYKNKSPDEALAAIHARVGEASSLMCAWYWTSIRTKRRTSLAARGLAVVLLGLGTALPLFAAIQPDDRQRLLFTQTAVACLAAAGLCQLADRIFGWSTGWMRYITTVTTMENLTRAFELEWGHHLLVKQAPPDRDDARKLFDLAQAFESRLTALQADETKTWVAEFNAGIATLESMVKNQRDETDRKLEEIRTSLASRAADAAAQAGAGNLGAVQVMLQHPAGMQAIRIALDDEDPVAYTGLSWTQAGVTPGWHVVRVQAGGDPPRHLQSPVAVEAGGIGRIEIALP